MVDGAKQHPQEFPTTWWTLVEEALADGTTLRTAALDQLVLRYVPPLRAHLVLRKRLNPELADELLQAFIVEKIVTQYLLRHTDRAKGKFRSLLVRSLENFCADWGRQRAVLPATGMTALLDDATSASANEPDVFEIAWARQLLNEVLLAMKADCDAHRQADVWGVFQCRLLSPVYGAREPVPYEEVCRQFGFASPEQASNALMTAKRKFQRAFERVAAGYQHDGEDTDGVLGELIDILSRAGPLEWSQMPQASVPTSDGASVHPTELDHSQPSLLARMLEAPADAERLWRADDWRGLMRHQLAQPLANLDLKVTAGLVDAERARSAAALITLEDLFRHPSPPLELLEAVKRYGRKLVHRPTGTLPDEIASALYFASIAAALVHHDRRISTSDDELLRFGFGGLLARKWIETPLQELLEQALGRLSSRNEG